MSRSSFAARAGLSVGLAALLTFSPAFAMGPFERNAPEVEAGMKAYDAGNYDEALKHFDAARDQAKESPALEFDRGNALYKLKRYEEAQQAYQHVAEADPGTLTSRDYYNLGNAWAAMKKNPEAIAAYRHALTLDPSDEQARHNLEILLQQIPPPKKQQPKSGPDGGSDGGSDAGSDGGSPDAGRPDGGADGGSDGGSDAGMGDAGADAGQDGGAGDAGADAGSDGGSKGKGDGGSSDAGDSQDNSQSGSQDMDGGADAGSEDGGTSDQDDQTQADDAGTESQLPNDMSKKDAERLLDAMKQNEKNLQLWRFQQHKRQRKPNEKDW